MATSEREQSAFVGLLGEAGRKFGFFQAVRLLHQLVPGSIPVGELGPASQEPVRFRHDPSLIFHASDIDRIEVEDAGGRERAVVTTTFLGLTGTTSPLATVFTEDVLRADTNDDSALRGLYDLLHHRLVSLFYRTWKKYRFQAGFRPDASDAFSRRMLAFVGVDVAGAIPRRGLTAFELLALTPLLATPSRPARTVQIVLARFLQGAPVEVEPFVLRRVHIRDDDRVLLGRRNNVLGVDFTIGRTVPDRSGRFRVVVGPVDFRTFEALMPGGERHAQLRDVILQIAPMHLEPELELILDTEQAPRFQLGTERGGRLGVTTHLPRRDMKTMRGRVILSEDVSQAVPRLFTDGAAPPG
jgi:type VI secretion system protein ImpH